jgi:hypothetical protein
MSVVGEPLVVISNISVTYVCGRRSLDIKTKGSSTTDIGDADLRY